MTEPTIKDSGQREDYDGGMVRDTEEGKLDWTNLFFGPMARRWAAHTTKGRAKYNDPEPGIPNWSLGLDLAVWLRARRSFLRHQLAWLAGQDDEDHAAGMFFNVNLKEYIEERLNDKDTAAARNIERLHARAMGFPEDGLPVPSRSLVAQEMSANEVREAEALPHIEVPMDTDGRPAFKIPPPGWELVPGGPKPVFAHDYTTEQLERLGCIRRVDNRGTAMRSELLARGAMRDE